jgi:hypothetical protein
MARTKQLLQDIKKFSTFLNEIFCDEDIDEGNLDEFMELYGFIDYNKLDFTGFMKYITVYGNLIDYLKYFDIIEFTGFENCCPCSSFLFKNGNTLIAAFNETVKKGCKCYSDNFDDWNKNCHCKKNNCLKPSLILMNITRSDVIKFDTIVNFSSPNQTVLKKLKKSLLDDYFSMKEIDLVGYTVSKLSFLKNKFDENTIANIYKCVFGNRFCVKACFPEMEFGNQDVWSCFELTRYSNVILEYNNYYYPIIKNDNRHKLCRCRSPEIENVESKKDWILLKSDGIIHKLEFSNIELFLEKIDVANYNDTNLGLENLFNLPIHGWLTEAQSDIFTMINLLNEGERRQLLILSLDEYFPGFPSLAYYDTIKKQVSISKYQSYYLIYNTIGQEIGLSNFFAWRDKRVKMTDLKKKVAKRFSNLVYQYYNKEWELKAWNNTIKTEYDNYDADFLKKIYEKEIKLVLPQSPERPTQQDLIDDWNIHLINTDEIILPDEVLQEYEVRSAKPIINSVYLGKLEENKKTLFEERAKKNASVLRRRQGHLFKVKKPVEEVESDIEEVDFEEYDKEHEIKDKKPSVEDLQKEAEKKEEEDRLKKLKEAEYQKRLQKEQAEKIEILNKEREITRKNELNKIKIRWLNEKRKRENREANEKFNKDRDRWFNECNIARNIYAQQVEELEKIKAEIEESKNVTIFDRSIDITNRTYTRSSLQKHLKEISNIPEDEEPVSFFKMKYNKDFKLSPKYTEILKRLNRSLRSTVKRVKVATLNCTNIDLAGERIYDYMMKKKINLNLLWSFEKAYKINDKERVLFLRELNPNYDPNEKERLYMNFIAIFGSFFDTIKKKDVNPTSLHFIYKFLLNEGKIPNSKTLRDKLKENNLPLIPKKYLKFIILNLL